MHTSWIAAAARDFATCCSERGGSAPAGAAAFCRRLSRGFGQHAERTLVGVEQRLLLVEIGLIQLSNLDDLAHGLDVEATALGLGIDFLDRAVIDGETQ